MMLPEYQTWTHEGKLITQVTPRYKRALLADYAKCYQCKTFVETGTCEGDTVAELASMFEMTYSIELNPEYYERAAKRFADSTNVMIIHGDSGVELPKLLPILEEPVLFWIDAHLDAWTGPVKIELQAIYDSGISGVVLIDDMDYIGETLPRHPDWSYELIDGIVRCVHVVA